MRRYAAWHKTEPGYTTAKGAEECITRQDSPEDYYVVATDNDFEPHPEMEAFMVAENEQHIQDQIDQAVLAERQRIIKVLGLLT